MLDHQAGEILAPAWGVPIYIPEQDLASPHDVGKTLEGTEFQELGALLDVLWEARIFERWWGVITEVACASRENGERRWYLRLTNSAWLAWGLGNTGHGGEFHSALRCGDSRDGLL